MLLHLAMVAWAARAEESAPPRPLSDDERRHCLEVLEEGLRSDEFWPAMHAAEALSLAGQGGTVRQALLPKVAMESDDQKRCGLARELVRAGDRAHLQTLFRILEDVDSPGRTHAAESLYKLGELRDGSALRAAFAQGENPRLQLMAGGALARGGNPAALALIRRQLSSSETEFRKIAAWLLTLLGDSQDVAPLAQLLARETDLLTRAYITHALACLNESSGNEGLRRNLGSDDPAVRTYAAEFAGYSRDTGSRDQLLRLLEDGTRDVRIRAAQSLIALSLPPEALGLPRQVCAEDIARDVYPATSLNPRYSEGSLAVLRDGRLLYAVTEFQGGGADHATAHIVAATSDDGGRSWSALRELQANTGRQNVMSVTLCRLRPESEEAPWGMFYLEKNSPTDLKVMLRTSTDELASFGPPVVVTPGRGYHVMNNDRVCVMSSGRLLCPVAFAPDLLRQGHFVSRCFFSDDQGGTWQSGQGLVDEPRRGAMEPEVLELPDGRLRMMVRTQLGYIGTACSQDGGDTWSYSGQFPLQAPEAPATLRRIPATGDLLLVWNNHFVAGAGHGGRRTPLTAAISSDEGRTWRNFRDLETSQDQSFAYTGITFHKDRALLTYYVSDDTRGWISSRFRSLPVAWFYEQGNSSPPH